MLIEHNTALFMVGLVACMFIFFTRKVAFGNQMNSHGDNAANEITDFNLRARMENELMKSDAETLLPEIFI